MQTASYYLLNQPVKGSGPRPQISRAVATLALCQFYGQTQEAALKGPAQRGIEQICAAQNMTTGGWDSGDNDQADIELATWNLLALKEAHLSYLPVPPANVTAAAKWFGQQATLHTQQGSEKVEPGILLGRCYFGLRSHPWCEDQLERLTAEEPSSRTLPTDYFAMRAVCEYGTRTKADDDWMQQMRQQVKARPLTTSQRQDIRATALRVMIERSRRRHWIYSPSINEDDFPL